MVKQYNPNDLERIRYGIGGWKQPDGSPYKIAYLNAFITLPANGTYSNYKLIEISYKEDLRNGKKIFIIEQGSSMGAKVYFKKYNISEIPNVWKPIYQRMKTIYEKNKRVYGTKEFSYGDVRPSGMISSLKPMYKLWYNNYFKQITLYLFIDF